MKAQLALRMKYRLKAVRKRHCVPHGSGARARAKFRFVERGAPSLGAGVHPGAASGVMCGYIPL